MFNLVPSRQINYGGVWILSLLAILSVPWIACAATGEPDLSVSSVSGAPGNSVSVWVTGDFSRAVSSIQFGLQFDPKLLTVSHVAAGSATSFWTIVNNPKTPGTVMVGMFSLGDKLSAVLGPQKKIAVITFTVNKSPKSAARSSSLTLSRVNFDAAHVTQLIPGTFTEKT